VAQGQFDRGTLGRDRPDRCALFAQRYQFPRCPRNVDRAGSVAAAVLTWGVFQAMEAELCGVGTEVRSDRARRSSLPHRLMRPWRDLLLRHVR